MNRTYKAAVFDMDGTLIDSLADLAASANEVMRSFNFLEHTLEEYRNFVGNGARKLMERSLPAKERENTALIDEATARYIKCYLNGHLLDKTKPYDGILEMLDTLKSRGVKLAICTNKPHDAAVKVAEKLFPPNTFSAIVGDKKGLKRKPDPTNLLKIIADFGVPPAETAYFGDSGTDMKTAVNAEVLPVGVAWGFRPQKELWETGAKTVLVHPNELLNKVEFVEQ